MADSDTVALGRPRRSTAGNRMRELLEKAHQEDEDEFFAEVEDDDEFAAPQDIRDVYLEDFADTDDEVELDEEEEERLLRREERRAAKGKQKAVYDPLAPGKSKRARFAPDPNGSSPGPSTTHSAAHLALLDPSIDPDTMAPTTLVLELRRRRREEKRLNRNEGRRSTMRASTLKTETEFLEREKAEKDNPNRKGRRAQHETGEMRVKTKMTQAELIEQALEEEERNKEALRDWLRKEEERRELRRVGRKRVRGPRWTWISRTVGKMVELVGEVRSTVAEPTPPPPAIPPVVAQEDVSQRPSEAARTVSLGEEEDPVGQAADVRMSGPPISPTTSPIQLESSQHALLGTAAPQSPPLPSRDEQVVIATDALRTDPAGPSTIASGAESSTTQSHLPAQATALNKQEPTLEVDSAKATDKADTTKSDDLAVPALAVYSIANNATTSPSVKIPSLPTGPEAAASPQAHPPTASETTEALTGPYMRNYLILSEIPGGLAEELKLILGDHVEWDQVSFIPHRNRPIVRRPPLCPFTGLPARYRHPSTNIPYATLGGYKEIEALLAHRYVWSEGAGTWVGGEEDVIAEGARDIPGWREAMHGGWMGGRDIHHASSGPEAGDATNKAAGAAFGEAEEVEDTEEVILVAKKGKGKRKSETVPVVKKEDVGMASMGGKKRKSMAVGEVEVTKKAKKGK